MKPTSQQLAVIESEDRDILVEAGAGSGKTTTTVNRYIRLLAEREYEPREILAFTFTDKAAGELRDKVRVARRRLAEERGETNPQAFSMSSAWVGTFHAICSRILKAYPVEAGVDPGFTVIDDVTGETVRSQAFSEALSAFQREDRADDRREAMIGLFTERTLRRSTFSTYDELRSRGIERPRLPDFTETAYPAEKIAYLRENVAALGEKKLHWKTKRSITSVQGLFERIGDRELVCSELAPLRFGSTNEDCAEFCEVLTSTISDLAAYEGGDFARRGFGRLLELFDDRYAELKARRSVLDYEDLQLVTLRLLQDNHRIRDAYRDRFREIMVDEFQDTNQLQLDLVTALRGEKTTLMTVGDEMQSIYGFRHADVELFRQRRNAPGVRKFRLSDNFRSQPEVIAAINEIGLTLDGQVKRKREPEAARSRHEFAELTVGIPASDAGSTATAILTGHDDWKSLDLGELAPRVPPEAEVGKDQDHFNEAEALRVAHHLRELVDSGVARQGEIAVLLRAKTRSDLYVNALKAVGLSPYLTGGRGFWKSREAVDLRSLLSVIANPLEDEALLGALTSPACGVSSNALWLIRRGSPEYATLWPTVRAVAGGPLPEGASGDWLDEIPPEDREAISVFVATVDRLRSRDGVIPLDALVDEAITATGYDLANLIRDPSRNGMANVRRVASLAHDFELAEGRDLRGFLNWITLSADLDTESSVATEEEESDVIRIMTIHAAKGLEFKVACVPDCGRQNTSRHDLPIRLGRSKPSGDPLDFPLGLRLPRIDGNAIDLYDWTALAEAAKLASEDEELRLFHVAVTRAEEHLIVSGVLPDKFSKKDAGKVSDSLSMISRFAMGFELDPEDPQGWLDAVPGGSEPDAEIKVIPNIASDESAELLRRKKPSLLATRDIRCGVPPIHRPASKVFPNVPLSFTALNEFDECPARFFARRVLRLEAPEEADARFADGDPAAHSLIKRDRATAFGSAVHDVLEALGKSRWPEPRDSSIATALRQRGADPEEDLVLARTMINGFLGSGLGVRVRRGDASFELPLLIRIGRVTVRGFADVLVDDPVPLVLDYKTNYLGDMSPVEKMADYVQQRNLYALAVARSRGLDRVDTAFVFLDRPDEPVLETLERPDLDHAEAELEASLSDITAGRFFGEDDARRKPCGTCWACSALERQLARGDSPAADPLTATGPTRPAEVL
ncbi:MAG: UvrD-helicase domain-containing protein [Actinomycetota bacterium]|nr:UvrD-helicase domain-containing protein [Actinomycetota bacterium]